MSPMFALQLQCPACHKPITCQTRVMSHVVCSSCYSIIARDEKAEERSLYVTVPVPEDCSPIHVGTTGQHDGKDYQVTGRWHFRMNDGYFNYWALLYTDSGTGWLLESMGVYVIGTEHTETYESFKQHSFHPGDMLELGETRYHIEAISKNVKLYAEGELPVQRWPMYGFFCIEMVAEKGGYSHLMVFDKTQLYRFDGAYTTTDTMKNLRGVYG